MSIRLCLYTRSSALSSIVNCSHVVAKIFSNKSELYKVFLLLIRAYEILKSTVSGGEAGSFL